MGTDWDQPAKGGEDWGGLPRTTDEAMVFLEHWQELQGRVTRCERALLFKMHGSQVRIGAGETFFFVSVDRQDPRSTEMARLTSDLPEEYNNVVFFTRDPGDGTISMKRLFTP